MVALLLFHEVMLIKINNAFFKCKNNINILINS